MIAKKEKSCALFQSSITFQEKEEKKRKEKIATIRNNTLFVFFGGGKKTKNTINKTTNKPVNEHD